MAVATSETMGPQLIRQECNGRRQVAEVLGWKRWAQEIWSFQFTREIGAKPLSRSDLVHRGSDGLIRFVSCKEMAHGLFCVPCFVFMLVLLIDIK